MIYIGALRGFAADEGVGAVGIGGSAHTDVLARWTGDPQDDMLTGEGRAADSVLQESVESEGLVNGRRIICCEKTSDGFLKVADADADRSKGGAVDDVAGEACLVVVIALGGFAASEGVGTVGVGGGGADPTPVA